MVLLGKWRRGFSRRHCLFFILVLTAVLFFYCTDIKEMTTGWNPAKWWIPFKDHRQNVGSRKNGSLPSELTGFQTQSDLTVLLQTENITATNMTNRTATNTKASAVTQQLAQTIPPAPVPYKSPGLYLVEYPYKYSFIINEPKTCEQQKPFLVLMVPVALHNRAHRDIIRSTWGGESLVLGKVVNLFFLLGLPTGEGVQQLQDQLLQESREHHDLLQSDFLDCYKNLTIKTMVMLEWLDSHCSITSYAMKIDSDMFLNVPRLVHMLSSAPKTNYMTGLVAKGATVLRDPRSKWFVPVELYSLPEYPRYALGLGYVLSIDLPKKLILASRHVKAIYIEDVYLGLCMQYLGIPPANPPNWGYFQVFPVWYSRCAYSRLIATTTHDDTNRVRDWKDFKKNSSTPYC
ncbi:beta-1,3-galactosyltransferase 1-like [Notothenia coriiceps]|uniref:Hexosyltransferase n=1 Tax=Notothenia coriiceps TaxID=8208 RepID=A0A6I9PH85_9TELE|nr:PREDICTED: beta-1,3-galactosyltransferase 1-like [Notothenia coriiceps]